MINTSNLKVSDNGRVVVYTVETPKGERQKRGKLVGHSGDSIFLEVVKNPHGYQPKKTRITVKASAARFESDA